MATLFLIHRINRTCRQGLEEAKFSADDWYNLLSVSHRYGCERARKRSIKEIEQLDPPADNVDRIVMARKFGVEQWLVAACVALVEREDPLTYAEAEKLGLDMTVAVSEAREKYIRDMYGYGESATVDLVKSILHIK